MKILKFSAVGFFCIALSFSSCKELELEIKVPKCVEKEIRKIEKEEGDSYSVWEWKVDGKVFYYISSPCCDKFNWLYDNNCNKVCAPDGGISGQGDGNCPQFEGKIEKTLVWEEK